jgi:hypothetical protein
MILLLFLLLRGANAWWGNGHMVIANIAVLELQKSNPNALKVANLIISEYADFYPGTKEFIPSASWRFARCFVSNELCATVVIGVGQ